MSTRILFRSPLLHLTNGKLHVRRKLNFCATAKPIEFKYASKTLKGPTLGQSPVESCTQSLVENGYECQTDDLQEIGTIDETCFVEAKDQKSSPGTKRLSRMEAAISKLAGQLLDSKASQEEAMKPLQPRLARDLMRQCFVREIEPKGTDEALILDKADSSRWQITFANYVAKTFSPPNKGLVPPRWRASAIQALQLGRQESTIQDANATVHQLPKTARASRWVFLFQSCEALLSGPQLSNYKEAAVLAFGNPGESYDTMRIRVEKKMEADQAEESESFMGAVGL